MRIKGFIHDYDNDLQIITVKKFNKLKKFYFQKSLYKKFKRFFSENEVIDLLCYDDETIHNGYLAYQVMYVIELFMKLPKRDKIFYDKTYLNESMNSFFKSLNNKLFIDFEMTMPNYKHNDHFVPEIIQAGFFIVNSNNEIIEKYNYHIRPSKMKYINSRTKSFLHLEKISRKETVSYYKFYNKFKSLINKYRPAVITFGKNDKLVLNNSYRINNLPSLAFITRFVNLSHIIKNYYELKNDPGLFNLYEKYYNVSCDQVHDALDDAIVTKKVFDAFICDISNGGKKIYD